MGRNRRARYGMQPRLFSVAQCRALYELSHGVHPESAAWFCDRGGQLCIGDSPTSGSGRPSIN
jgi:hypothetical protein